MNGVLRHVAAVLATTGAVMAVVGGGLLAVALVLAWLTGGL